MSKSWCNGNVYSKEGQKFNVPPKEVNTERNPPCDHIARGPDDGFYCSLGIREKGFKGGKCEPAVNFDTYTNGELLCRSNLQLNDFQIHRG